MSEEHNEKASQEELAKELGGYARHLTKAVSMAGKVASAEKKGKNIALFAATELQAAKKLLDELQKEPMLDRMDQLHAILVQREKDALKSAEREAMRLLSDLDGRMRQEGLHLAGHYPEVTCDIFTLVFQLTGKGMQVSFYYGPQIEKLDTVAGADTDSIWKTFKALRKTLTDSLLPAETFLPMARKAWRTAHAIAGNSSPQGALPILDVLHALAFINQKDAFRRNPVRSAFRSYSATALSYQLFLQRERRFDDQELVMGIATREDVRSKSSLWVPRNLRGDGNHFATMEFRKVV